VLGKKSVIGKIPSNFPM